MVSLCLRQGIVVCVGVSLPKDFYDCTYVAFVMTRVKQCAGRQPFIVPSTECLLTDSACAVLFRSEHAACSAWHHPPDRRRQDEVRLHIICMCIWLFLVRVGGTDVRHGASYVDYTYFIEGTMTLRT